MRHFLDLESTGAEALRLILDEAKRRKQARAGRPKGAADDDAPLAQTAREVGGVPVLLDVTAPDATERLLAVAREHGGLDVVVHNAGITRDKTLAKMDAAQWELAVEVNLGAVVRLTDALIAHKALKKHARVVLLSSVSGLTGNAGQTNYAASKAGIFGFTKAAAR